MILCIDAGNSRVKWGWHDGQGWTSIRIKYKSYWIFFMKPGIF